MSDKRRTKRPAKVGAGRGPNVVRLIARANGENEADVKAAIAALVADGIDFEELWNVHLPFALNQGGVVDYAARKLAERKAARGGASAESMTAAEGLVSAVERALAKEREA